MAIAYVPQVLHLALERCSAGISIKAWILWLVAGVLILSHALAISDAVFIALQIVGLVLMSLIILLAVKYKDSYCEGHMPAHAKRPVRRKG